METDITLSREQIDRLGDDIALCAARIDSATHELLTHIRTFDRARGWATQGAKSCAHWLSWRIGLGLGAAREHVRVAHRLPEFPQIDEAFRRGELSFTKVRAMVREGMPAEKEEVMLHQARGASGAQLERICSAYRSVTADRLTDEDRRYVRRRTHGDGTISIEMRLLPDEAERVYQALRETKLALAAADHADNTVDSAESPTLADAAVAMAEAQLATAVIVDASGGDRRQLFVHLREERIADTTAWKAELVDGTPLCGDTLKRIACDSGLVVAKTGDAGDPLDIGRRRRTVSAPLRRALMMRDRHCQFPGCDQTAFLDAHHLEHWINGGATRKDNLILTCHAHHVALHEGGFRAERNADGALTFYDADGRCITPTAPKLEQTGTTPLAIRQREHGIAIDPRTSLPHWDGARLALGAAVGALMH